MNKNILKCKLFTLAPTGRESGCYNQFNYNHERGVLRPKYADRGTESAMTNIGANLPKNTCRLGFPAQQRNLEIYNIRKEV